MVSNFVKSVNAALEGVVHTLRSERNMRIHFLIGFLVLIAGVYFNLTSVEYMVLCFAVTFVLVSEMFNTAIEHIVDMHSGEKNYLAGMIKDIAAGAVFVSAVNAIIVGYILLSKKIGSTISSGFSAIRHSPWHVTFISFLLVVGVVLFIKIVRKEESLLRGGMPSGHSAAVFAIWVSVSLITDNSLISLLVFFLAFLVAKSRIASGVHTVWEVIVGSVIGVILSLMVFQILL